jgi:hypothetical protein
MIRDDRFSHRIQTNVSHDVPLGSPRGRMGRKAIGDVHPIASSWILVVVSHAIYILTNKTI